MVQLQTSSPTLKLAMWSHISEGLFGCCSPSKLHFSIPIMHHIHDALWLLTITSTSLVMPYYVMEIFVLLINFMSEMNIKNFIHLNKFL